MSRLDPLTIGSVLCVALSVGCTWVSSKDVDKRRPEVDDDQDGFIAEVDCDESNPNINPGATENWYDGIDQDCGTDDDYDADVDGYVDTQWVGLPTAGVDGTGALPGGDCNDSDPVSNPGQSDEPYDGVDTNCDGTDDYDQDGDGFVSSEHEGLPTRNATGTGNLPGGDCDDSQAEVRPGTTDAWYDGIDQDCAGNDDYDADGDGYVSDEDAGKATAYVDSSGALPAGDCNDSNSFIHPAAEDTWYDDIDSDCAGDDDFDQDLDGYRHPTAPGGSGLDCDDDDATVYPGSGERLTDDVDQDCDGDPDSFLFREETRLTWTGARDLRFGSNSDTIYLSVSVEQASYGATTFYESAIALSFDGLLPLDGATAHLAWLQNLVPASFTLSPGTAFMATDDELLGAVGLVFEDDGLTSLRISGYDLSTGVRFGANSPSSSPATFDDLALALSSDGDIHAIGCEQAEGVGQYMQATREGLTTGYEISEAILDLPTDTCALHFFEDPIGTVVSTQAAGLVRTRFDLRSATPFTDLYDCGLDTGGDPIECPDPDEVDGSRRPADIETLVDRSWLVLADETNDLVVIVEEDGTEHTIAADGPSRVQATLAPDGTVFLAWVDGRGNPVLAWGDLTAGFESVTLDPGFSATEASLVLSTDGSLIVVAALGGDQIAVGGAAL